MISAVQIVSRTLVAIGALALLSGFGFGIWAFNGGTGDQQIWSLIIILAGGALAAFGYFMALALAPYRSKFDKR